MIADILARRIADIDETIGDLGHQRAALVAQLRDLTEPPRSTVLPYWVWAGPDAAAARTAAFKQAVAA